MVGVEMREDDLADISSANAPCMQLRAEFLVGMHGKASGAPVERMPPWVISAVVDPRRFPRVDDDDSLFVLDDPGVHGSHSDHSSSNSMWASRAGPRPRASICGRRTWTSPVRRAYRRHPGECAGVATYTL